MILEGHPGAELAKGVFKAEKEKLGKGGRCSKTQIAGEAKWQLPSQVLVLRNAGSQVRITQKAFRDTNGHAPSPEFPIPIP